MDNEGTCSIADCHKSGRILGSLGTIKLVYCPKHRKYGQAVINTFMTDVFNYKKSLLFDLAKQELLFGGEKILDEKNYESLGSWFKKEIYRTYIEDIGSAAVSIESTIYFGPEETDTELGSPVGSPYPELETY